jgi:hypothetical protein
MTTPLPSLSSVPFRQSRAASMAEAVVNVAAGFVLAIMLQAIAYPVLGIATTSAQDGVIALLFTALSLLRSYTIRRLFIVIARNRDREQEARARSLDRRLATGKLPQRRKSVARLAASRSRAS